RIQVGDASTVFWAEEVEHPIESAFAALFGIKKKDDPTQAIEYVKQVFDSVRAGKLVEHGQDSRFHVLALAPNAARLSVRFWHTATVAELSPRFQ
ncbi:type I-C CRISPR-associated protein Cas8c/Csd1, partial [Salmonella enterica]|nr:type I-C CRISPR-associated protein Cas8c/Csd1 [Salmonella enterica]